MTPGDLIIQFDGEDIKGNADFENLMQRHQPCERVKLTIERDGNTLQAEVVLRGV